MRTLLTRPHSRARRDRRWIVTRLACYPLIAMAAVFVYVGFTSPEALDTEYMGGVEVITEGAGR